MNREEIGKLARESGLFVPREGIRVNGALMRFAAMISEKERAACAQVCEQDGLLWGQRYAEAIRARGKE